MTLVTAGLATEQTPEAEEMHTSTVAVLLGDRTIALVSVADTDPEVLWLAPGSPADGEQCIHAARLWSSLLRQQFASS